MLVGNKIIPPLFTDPFVHFWPILPTGKNNSSKKGGICLLPTNFLCVLDAKFNVDYDFVIKHDLIL